MFITVLRICCMFAVNGLCFAFTLRNTIVFQTGFIYSAVTNVKKLFRCDSEKNTFRKVTKVL